MQKEIPVINSRMTIPCPSPFALSSPTLYSLSSTQTGRGICSETWTASISSNQELSWSLSYWGEPHCTPRTGQVGGTSGTPGQVHSHRAWQWKLSSDCERRASHRFCHSKFPAIAKAYTQYTETAFLFSSFLSARNNNDYIHCLVNDSVDLTSINKYSQWVRLFNQFLFTLSECNLLKQLRS